MGHSRASEVLLLGRKLTAEAAAAYGLVNEVWEDGEFKARLEARAAELASLPPQASCMTKGLLRNRHRAALHAANAEECATIKGRWVGAECMEAIQRFFMASAAKKA